MIDSADVVIVCAAAKQAIENALSSVDRKGKILFFAVPRNPTSAFRLRDSGGMRSVCSFHTAQDLTIYRAAIDYQDKGLINAGKMITHRVPLSEIMKGFKLVSEARRFAEGYRRS